MYFFDQDTDSETTERDDETIEISVEDIYYTQDSISRRFRHGQFAGSLLDDVIELIEEGDVDEEDLQLAIFQHGGEYYAFNNRTLYVLKTASNINVVTAILWNRPNNFRDRIGFDLDINVR